MLVKVGDHVVLKKNLPADMKISEEKRKKFPLEVREIGRCPSRGNGACKECPGYINDMVCFGRSSSEYCGYIIEPILGDWDE